MSTVYNFFTRIPDNVSTPGSVGPAWPDRVRTDGLLAGARPTFGDSVFVAGVTAEMSTLLLADTPIVNDASPFIGLYHLSYVDSLIANLTGASRILLRDGQTIEGWITKADSYSLTGPSSGGMFQYQFGAGTAPRYLLAWTDTDDANRILDWIGWGAVYAYAWAAPQFGGFASLPDQMAAVLDAVTGDPASPGLVEATSLASQGDEFVRVIEHEVPASQQLWKSLSMVSDDYGGTDLYNEADLLSDADSGNWINNVVPFPYFDFGVKASVSMYAESDINIIVPDGRSARQSDGTIFIRWPDISLTYEAAMTRFAYLPEGLNPTIEVYLAIEGLRHSFGLHLPFQYWKNTDGSGVVTSNDPAAATVDLGPLLADAVVYGADLVCRGGVRPSDWEPVPGYDLWDDPSPLEITGDRVDGPTGAEVATYQHDGGGTTPSNYGGVFIVKVGQISEGEVLTDPGAPALSDVISRLVKSEFLERSVITDERTSPVSEAKRADLHASILIEFSAKLILAAKIPRGFRCAPFKEWTQ